MIRVALSTTVVQRGRSGVAAYLFGLLDGLAAIDAPVQVILLGLADDANLFTRWLNRCEWVAVPESTRPALRNIFWHQTAIRRVLREVRAEVVHIPSYRRIIWKPPVPQVVTIHDCAAFNVRGKYDAARMFYGRRVARPLARAAQAIVTVSGATAADVDRHFGIPVDRQHVIWNGIDHGRFHPQPAAEVAAHLRGAHRQNNPYFLYLARLEHPAKNHVRLIEAFERFATAHPENPHDLIFGGADWHGAEHIHARIAASPMRQRIRNLGFVADADLPRWYAGATAMVYPSLFEGFGLPPIEAMACGCPVIASPRGSLREVVDDAARLIDPLSPEDIAGALAELTETTAAAAWRERGLRRAAVFDWRETARQLTQVYQKTAQAGL
ncbi:MAG: glycosyltransferase family 1 protein [Opitutaceae bacterium]